MRDAGRHIYFTICSANYLHYAATLAETVRRTSPNVRFVCILADEPRPDVDWSAALGFEVIAGRALGVPEYYDMAMRYDVVEFNTALKPYAFQHVFDVFGAEAAAYLDPDLYLLKPLDHVNAAFEDDAACVLTPHITEPLGDDAAPDDMRILRTGVFNLGFAAFRNCAHSRRFIDWWAARMPADCRVDLENGIFVDQKYLDLAPSYIDGCRILHHPGYNVAYWNLPHRRLARGPEGGWRANDKPLHFMHFSGVRMDAPRVVSKHQDRLAPSDLGEGAALFEEYREALRRNWATIEASGASVDYAYGTFTDGTRIEPVLRRTYQRLTPSAPRGRAEAFDADAAVYAAPAADLPDEASPFVTEVMYELWNARPHIQSTFHIRTKAGARAFAIWFVQVGCEEWGLDRRYAPKSARALVARGARSRRWAFLQMLEWIQKIRSASSAFPRPVRRLGVQIKRRILPFVISRIQR